MYGADEPPSHAAMPHCSIFVATPFSMPADTPADSAMIFAIFTPASATPPADASLLPMLIPRPIAPLPPDYARRRSRRRHFSHFRHADYAAASRRCRRRCRRQPLIFRAIAAIFTPHERHATLMRQPPLRRDAAMRRLLPYAMLARDAAASALPIIFFFFFHARMQRCAAFARCAADAYAAALRLMAACRRRCRTPIRRHYFSRHFCCRCRRCFHTMPLFTPAPMIRADAAILLAMPPPLYARFTLIAAA
jgi:hypothetical protein